MSRKIGIPAAVCLILGIIAYLAHDEAGTFASTSDFLALYLHTPQRYLYLVSLYTLLLLCFLRIPYYTAEYHIRIRGSIFVHLCLQAFLQALCISVFLFAAHLILPLCFGIPFAFSAQELSIFLTLLLFVLSCILLYYLLYFLSLKPMFSLIGVFISNLLVLAIIFALNFYVYANQNSETRAMAIFYAYLSIVILGSLAVLLKYADKRECLA